MTHKFLHRLKLVLILFAFLPAGCHQGGSNVVMMAPAVEYGRLEIDDRELTAGLSELFGRMEGEVGPFDQTGVLDDYLGAIRKGLAERGFCRVQNLHINQARVDLDIFFRVDQQPAALTLAAYVDGKATPSFVLVNRYKTVQTAAAAGPRAE